MKDIPKVDATPPVATQDQDPTKTRTSSPRELAGNLSLTISDTINDNLLVFRYAAYASIGTLFLFGVRKTPIFFRYKRVSGIPPEDYQKRKVIYGRLVGVVVENNRSLGAKKEEVPIRCWVRTLSPIGRMLHRSAFDYFLDKDTSRILTNDLMAVEIAGIQRQNNPNNESSGEWLQNMANQQSRVSCRLLSRREAAADTPSFSDTSNKNVNDMLLQNNEPIAICQIQYRPGKRFFRTDLASSLLRYGRASTTSHGMYIPIENWRVRYGSTHVKNVQSDVSYIEVLANEEMDAFRKKLGIWREGMVRASREDLVEEVAREEERIVTRLLRGVRGFLGRWK